MNTLKKLTKTIPFPPRNPHSSTLQNLIFFQCKNFASQNIMMFNLEITLKAYRIEYYDYYDKEDKLLNFEDVKKVLKVHNDYGGAKFSMEQTEQKTVSVHKIFIINDIYCFIMVSFNSSSSKNFVCFQGNLGIKQIPEIKTNFWGKKTGKKTGKLITEYITFENGIKRD